MWDMDIFMGKLAGTKTSENLATLVTDFPTHSRNIHIN
jgi:hypothetical protein